MTQLASKEQFVERFKILILLKINCGLVVRQDRSDTKKSVLVLVLQVLCCVVKYNLVTVVVKMILEDTAAFQILV